MYISSHQQLGPLDISLSPTQPQHAIYDSSYLHIYLTSFYSQLFRVCSTAGVQRDAVLSDCLHNTYAISLIILLTSFSTLISSWVLALNLSLYIYPQRPHLTTLWCFSIISIMCLSMLRSPILTTNSTYPCNTTLSIYLLLTELSLYLITHPLSLISYYL